MHMTARRAVFLGALVGSAAAASLLAAHVALLADAPRSPAWGLLGTASGALAGLAYRRAQHEVAFRRAAGGALLGALLALALLAFAAAGWLRARGAPAPLWALLLALLLLACYHVTQAVQRALSAARRLELPAALVAAAALPGWPLSGTAALYETGPGSLALAGALVASCIAGGAALAALARPPARTRVRRVRPSPAAEPAAPPPQPGEMRRTTTFELVAQKEVERAAAARAAAGRTTTFELVRGGGGTR
ncbi:MAG TPA: hypothetical protein VM582_09275 [Candidatus Thermoplasmatota archaeon]|nr:hypothetical protein [Candidatus Thermoplasmatota archaeon]